MEAILKEGFIPIAECVVGRKLPREISKRRHLPPQTGKLGKSIVEEPIEHNVHQAASSSSGDLSGLRAIILLPKLNQKRCILNPKDVHVSKNTRKRSSRFTMTINQCFEGVC